MGANEGGVVIPMFANYVIGMAKNLQRMDSMGANLDLDCVKGMERWWFS